MHLVQLFWRVCVVFPWGYYCGLPGSQVHRKWLLPLLHIHFEQLLKGCLTSFSTVKILDFSLWNERMFCTDIIWNDSITRVSITINSHSLLPQSMTQTVLLILVFLLHLLVDKWVWLHSFISLLINLFIHSGTWDKAQIHMHARQVIYQWVTAWVRGAFIYEVSASCLTVFVSMILYKLL